MEAVTDTTARGGTTSIVPLSKPIRLSKLHKVVQLTRPWFWPLSWAPMWFGTVLATGSWLPDPAGFLPFFTALVVMGPLVWGSVCSVNDLHDVATDRSNPRKRRSVLVAGDSDQDSVVQWHRVFSLAALVIALAIGPWFASGTAGVLALGWAYSVPPLRLKSRPGLDIAANAIPVGVLAPLAGWSLYRPVTEYPVFLTVLGLALAAALYIPTLVLDRLPDAAAGIRTFAVHRGAAISYRLGVVLWTIATGAWLWGLTSGVLVSRSVGWFQVGLLVVPLVAYGLLTRRPTITRMAWVCLAFCLPAADFMLNLQHPIGG